jgi:cation:H+ antiporter
VFFDLLITVLGLTILLGGGWLLVRSAIRLAAALGLSPLLIGATVVGFGTSAPEFVVSLVAGLEGAGGLALGNVIGSNVSNAFLVVGVAAVVSPLTVHPRLLRRELPTLLVASVAALLLGLGGTISRVEGTILFIALLCVVAGSFWEQRRENVPALPGMHHATRALVALDIALTVVGVVLLAVGSDMAVHGSVGIASALGLSDVVIGATVVAVGTSLPEVATTMVAAWRRQADLAVANVFGSNIFNVLGALGITGAVATVPVSSSLYSFEWPALLFSTVVLGALAWQGGRVSRFEGVALLALYAAFLGVIVVRGAS